MKAVVDNIVAETYEGLGAFIADCDCALSSHIRLGQQAYGWLMISAPGKSVPPPQIEWMRTGTVDKIRIGQKDNDLSAIRRLASVVLKEPIAFNAPRPARVLRSIII
jgi:hypothetical protein